MARMGFPGRVVSSNAPNSLLPKQLRGFMARLQYLRRKRGQLLNLRALRMLRCRWHKARAEVQPRTSISMERARSLRWLRLPHLRVRAVSRSQLRPDAESETQD